MIKRFCLTLWISSIFFTGSQPVAAQSSSTPTPLTAGSEPDALALACIGDRAAWDQRDELEPHIAASPVDPDHLVVAWMMRAPGGPGAMQASVSRDGGRSWSSPVTLPMGECAGGGAGGRFVSDPWVSIDAAGRTYVSGIEWAPNGDDGDSVSRLVVATADAGADAEWERSVLSDNAESGVSLDNTAIAAEPDREGIAYVTSTRFADGAGPAGLAVTEDGGATWTPLEPTRVPGPDAPIALAPQPLLGPEQGHLWIAYSHDPRGEHVAVMRSTDGGVTWHDPVPVASWSRQRDWPAFPGTTEELEVAPDIVSAALHRATGRLWIAHQTSSPEGDATLALAGSGDSGQSWVSTPLLPPGEVSWRPTMAVNSDGLVMVTWFAPAGDPVGEEYPTRVELAVLQPEAGGRAEVVARRTLDRFIWLRRRTGSRFLGDYHGLAAAGGAFVAAYSRSVGPVVRVHVSRIHPEGGMQP